MIGRRLALASAVIILATPAVAAPPLCGEGGITPPSAANAHVAAEYPILSTVLSEEGTATLSFVIGTDGKTGPAVVVKSSGSLRLDDASIETVRGWLYKPAQSGGAPVACVWQAQVRWLIPEPTVPPKKSQ